MKVIFTCPELIKFPEDKDYILVGSKLKEHPLFHRYKTMAVFFQLALTKQKIGVDLDMSMIKLIGDELNLGHDELYQEISNLAKVGLIKIEE